MLQISPEIRAKQSCLKTIPVKMLCSTVGGGREQVFWAQALLVLGCRSKTAIPLLSGQALVVARFCSPVGAVLNTWQLCLQQDQKCVSYALLILHPCGVSLLECDCTNIYGEHILLFCAQILMDVTEEEKPLVPGEQDSTFWISLCKSIN